MRVNLRLRGGKGGFGSLLKAQACNIKVMLKFNNWFKNYLWVSIKASYFLMTVQNYKSLINIDFQFLRAQLIHHLNAFFYIIGNHGGYLTFCKTFFKISIDFLTL